MPAVLFCKSLLRSDSVHSLYTKSRTTEIKTKIKSNQNYENKKLSTSVNSAIHIKMAPRFVTVLFLFFVVSVIHVLGLLLLITSEDRNIFGTQKILIIALSLTETGIVFVSTLRESVFQASGSTTNNIGLCLENYLNIVLSNMYYLIMFGITFDRFLEIRLNIKYRLYWDEMKTKKLIKIAFLLLNTVFVIYLLCFYIILKFHGNLPQQIYEIYYLCLVPIIDTLFVTAAVLVYGYIFLKLYKNRKRQNSLRKQVLVDSKIGYQYTNLNRFRVPFWIILTFILCLVVPDSMLVVTIISPKLDKHLHMVYFILYRIGYIVDPIIYLYNLHILRLKIGAFRGKLFGNRVSHQR